MNLNLFWDNSHQPQHLQQNDHLEKHHEHLVQHHQQHKQYHHHLHPQSLKCEYCDINFCNEDELNHHQLLHSRRKPYLCEECGARFPYNSILLWHKKTHNGQLPFKCDECGSQFQQNSMLVWHKRKHRTNHPTSDHDHHLQNNVILDNSNSNNIFYQQETNNMATFHGISTVPHMFSVPNFLSGPVLPVGNPSFHAVSSLTQRGLETAANIPSIIVENSSCSDHSLDNSGKIDKDKANDDLVYRCDICSSTFKHSEFLKNHIHTKHNTGQNNPYYQLNQTGNWRSSVIKRKNYSDRPFKCDLCGAGFKIEGHLKNHRLKHTTERPFKCKQCGLSYTENFLLELHERKHQTERPFKCTRCGAAFFRENQLQKHIMRHTGDLI